MKQEIISKIKESGAKNVLIQIPEGLKTKVQSMADNLESEGIKVMISCDPCYGACDIIDPRPLGCDLLVHIGHSKLLDAPFPVIYHDYSIESSIPEALLEKIEQEKICIVSTVQYLDCLPKAKSALENLGKTVFVGGQILGCSHESALKFDQQAEAYLFIGTGIFHPLGLALKTQKPVLFLDLESSQLTGMKKEKTRAESKRLWNIEKSKEARTFGILISTKPGQLHLDQATKAKSLIHSNGKKAYILAMNELSPAKLLGLNLDALVNCACPRLSQDSAQYKKPIVSAADLKKVFE